jgi:molybdate transport system substrate-binding protein
MPIRRRHLFGALPMLALAPARAREAGLVINCDTTLAPALRKVGAAFKANSGVPVFVFATGPGLILPQLLRDIQNDIVVTQIAILEQAAQAGVIASAAGSARWRNSLVIAGMHGAPTNGTFAASDPSPASDIDGPDLVARLGLRPAHLLGAVDTDEVAFLLTSGAAQAGLLHATDVHAAQRLEAIRSVPTDIHPSFVYAASVTRLARRPNPEAFITFLGTSEARALLTESGLEMQA